MSSSAECPLGQTGTELYDLEPPSAPPPVPSWSPFRRPGQIAPRSRYTPPPLPEGFARVELDDDYYLGPQWNDWGGEEHEYPARVFDIPAEQQERWAKAQQAYFAMQEEISALRDERLGRVPDGWARKPPYQGAAMSAGPDDLARFLAEDCPQCGTPGLRRHLSAAGGCQTCADSDPRPVFTPQRNYIGYGVATPPLTEDERRAYLEWYSSGLRNVFPRWHSGKVCYRLASGSMVHIKPDCRCRPRRR